MAENRKNPGCLLIATLVAALAIAFLAFMIAPVSQRLSAPIVCRGYVESVVTTSTSTTSDGKSSMSSQFYCVDDQNRAIPASSFLAFVVLLVETWVGVSLLVLVPAIFRTNREETP